MKAIIDLDTCHHKIFNTKEEWDADLDSYAGYRREYDAHNHGIGYRMSAGSIDRYQNEPEQFPCLMLIGNYMHMSIGPDEIANFFIYDFQLQDE